MATSQRAAIATLGGILGMLVIAGGVVAGCGGDDNGGSSGTSGTGSTGTSGTATSGTATSGTTSGTATSGVTGSSGSVDAGHDATVTDTGAPDTSTVPDGATHDTGADVVAVDAGCTSIHVLSDAGTATLVTGFDDGNISGWGALPNSTESDGGATTVPAVTAEFSPTVGATCPGSVMLAVPFPAYGSPNVTLSYNYATNSANYPLWTNFTRLHYAVKVVFMDAAGNVIEGSDAGDAGDAGDASDAASVAVGDGAPNPADYSELLHDNNYVDWGDYKAFGAGDNSYIAGPIFQASPWQAVSFGLSDDLTLADGGDAGLSTPSGATCTAGNACTINSELDLSTVMPDGGSAIPATVIVYIDDIWLE